MLNLITCDGGEKPCYSTRDILHQPRLDQLTSCAQHEFRTMEKIAPP